MRPRGLGRPGPESWTRPDAGLQTLQPPGPAWDPEPGAAMGAMAGAGSWLSPGSGARSPRTACEPRHADRPPHRALMRGARRDCGPARPGAAAPAVPSEPGEGRDEARRATGSRARFAPFSKFLVLS